ncbi:MAG: nuclear transport factor 2 family protein [Eubacterium sp.]|nr:nuclear transport factor 2 family protein [Eubacterium sp.]
MSNKDLSLHERIRNAAASIEVENVKARHTYYHGRADATGEWANIWSKSDECSWAHAFGRMRGFDQVWYGSVAQYDKMAMENAIEMMEIYPETTGKDPRPLMEASVHTLVTDVIEVAEDGMSARGSFITPGMIHSCLTPEKEKYCNVLWERYGSDFVCEDGEWKYLHEHVCPDILTRLDMFNWAAEEYARITAPQVEEQAPPTLGDPPPVTDPGPMHKPYSVLDKPQNTVPYPEPYKTLDNDNTYTPFRNK